MCTWYEVASKGLEKIILYIGHWGIHYTKVIFMFMELYMCREDMGDIKKHFCQEWWNQPACKFCLFLFRNWILFYVQLCKVYPQGYINYFFRDIIFFLSHLVQPSSFRFLMLLFISLLLWNIPYWDNRSTKKG